MALPEKLTICSENGSFAPPLNIATQAANVTPSLTEYTGFKNPTVGGSGAGASEMKIFKRILTTVQCL